MKRVSDHLLVTIERIVFGRVNPTTCQTVPLLKRNDFHLVPTEDTGQEEEEKKSNDTHNLDPITLEEFKDETVSYYDSLLFSSQDQIIIINCFHILYLFCSVYIPLRRQITRDKI